MKFSQRAQVDKARSHPRSTVIKRKGQLHVHAAALAIKLAFIALQNGHVNLFP